MRTIHSRFAAMTALSGVMLAPSDQAGTTGTPTTEAEKAKRAKVAERIYVTPDGESRNAKDNATALNFKFADGTVVSVAPGQFPANIQACLSWHGLSQKIGDSFASAKGNVAEAIDNANALIEVLMAGTWVEKGEGVGAAPSMVAEAIIRALTKAGQTVDDVRSAAIRDKVKVKETRDGALKDPAIAAAYAGIKAEKAAERAKELAKASKGVTIATTDF